MKKPPREIDAMSKFEELAGAPPKLHFWGGEWRVGGLGPPQIALLQRSMTAVGLSSRIIETGAGLSTLLMLALGARVTSFFTKEDLRARIVDAIVAHHLPSENWEPVLGSSEFTFPKYLDTHPRLSCDLVLIDGGHLIHTVFTDFTFAFSCLKQGGLMLIDDLQTPTVSVLYEVLKSATFVEQVDVAGKLVAFRKKVKARLPGVVGEFSLGNVDLTKIAADLNSN